MKLFDMVNPQRCTFFMAFNSDDVIPEKATMTGPIGLDLSSSVD